MPNIKSIEFNNNYEINEIDKNSFITGILRKYAKLRNKDINQLYFSYNGKFLRINDERKIKYLGKREITLFVYSTEKRTQNENLKDMMMNKNNLFNLSNIEFDIVTCENCYSIPKLTLINQNKVEIYCQECYLKTMKDISYFKKFIKNFKEEKIDLPNCTYNKNHKSKSSKYCLKCTKYLCEDCLKNHRISFEGKNHILIQQKIQNKYYCQYHQEYVLEKYCKECQIYLCSKCICSHEDNLIYSFAEENNKEEINEVIKNFNKFAEIIQSEEKTLNNYLVELENKIKSLKEIFNQYKERNISYFLFIKLLINNYKKINGIRNYNAENNILVNGNFNFSNSDNFIKEINNYSSNECFHSKYNKLYAFYMNKSHVKPLNYCEHFITQEFCNNGNIKKIIFVDTKIIFIFDKNQYLYYLYEKKNIEYEIIKILNSNDSFVRDIYPLKKDKFLSINENNIIILWKINKDNINSLGIIKQSNFITLDLFNKDNAFIIEKNNNDFRIKYYEFNKHLILLLFIKKKIYAQKNIFEDINYLVDNYEYQNMMENKEMLKNLIKNLLSKNEEENKNILLELNNKLLEEIDNKSSIIYKNIIENNLKKHIKFIINTNYIIFEISSIINNQVIKFKDNEMQSLNCLVNFYNLCYNIRKLYIYYLLISSPINNIYNLNNEYLLFMGQDYLFIKYSLLEREFIPVVTNNFIPSSVIDYNDYEIISIMKDYIILNDFNNKYIYIIENKNFLLFKKY